MLLFMLGMMIGGTLGIMLLACLVASRDDAPLPEHARAVPHTYAPHPSLDDLDADYTPSSPLGAKV